MGLLQSSMRPFKSILLQGTIHLISNSFGLSIQQQIQWKAPPIAHSPACLDLQESLVTDMDEDGESDPSGGQNPRGICGCGLFAVAFTLSCGIGG